MGLKIYREINNNTIEKIDNNILLEFICEVNLWDANSIFDCCLHYDEGEEEYIDVSETYYLTLHRAVENLKRLIERERERSTDSAWYKEATRCFDILIKVMNECEDGYFMLFVS